MFLLHCGFQKTPPEDIHLGSSAHFDFSCFKQTALNDGYTHEDSETVASYSHAFHDSRRNSFDYFQFRSDQSLSCVRLFATQWIAARQASLSITNSRSSLRLTSIASVMPSSHLILRHPLLLLPPIPPSITVFSSESALRMRCQSTRVSASASFPPKKSQGWSPSEWTGWISL